MEKLSTLVVLSFLIPNVLSKIAQYSSPQLSLWTLTVRDHIVSISQNGTLKSEPYLPTLYSIFRSELYINENEPYSLPEFSLAGIASGYRICMDRKGFVYTKKVTKKEKRWLKRLPLAQSTTESSGSSTLAQNADDNADLTDIDEDDDDDEQDASDNPNRSYQSALTNPRPRVTANSEDLKPQLPPAECLFRAHGFDPTHSYDYKTAIYRTSVSRSHSSKLIGNFIAFLKNGEPRRYRRPLDHLKMHSSIALLFDPIRKPGTSSMIARSNFYNTNSNNSDKKVETMLSTTQFNYCSTEKPGRKLFNIKVRKCVKNATKSLNISRLNHTNLSKIIQKCLCPLGKICRQNQCVDLRSRSNKNQTSGSKFSKHMRRNRNENRINKHNKLINTHSNSSCLM